MAWLHLLRHGTAETAQDDPPLSEEGAELMRLEALAMVRLGLAFDAIFTSPLRRARQTAEIVAGAFGDGPQLKTEKRLAPGCNLGSLDRFAPEAAGVLLVGHAPDLGRLAGELVGAGHALALRRGGLCCVELASWPPSPPGRLHFFLPPELLLAVGRAAGGG